MYRKTKRVILSILLFGACVLGVRILTACKHTHSFGEWEIMKNPTCIESGIRERWCSCGEKQSEEIPAVGHSETIDPGVEPTCTTTGKTEGKHCSVCGEVIVSQTSIPATGHKHQLISDTATCTENGQKEYKCSVCDDTYTIASDALGHTFSDYSITKQPTCTESGERSCECIKCHQSFTEIIEPVGHDYSEKIIKEVTCTENGEKEFLCSRCNHSYTESIKADGHSYNVETITKQPTCTKPGEKSYECTKCHQSFTEIIEPVGHDYSVKTTKEPTCTENGEKTFLCSRCNHSYTESIRAKGHSYDSVEITKQPTCTDSGVKSITCVKCHHSYSETLPALGHEFVNGTCSRCGLNDIKIIVSDTAPFTVEGWSSVSSSRTVIEVSKMNVSVGKGKIEIQGVACITNFFSSNPYVSPTNKFLFELFDEDGVKVASKVVVLSTRELNEKVSFSVWISIANLSGTYTLKCVGNNY